MTQSRQPRKQRKARYDAPLHIRQKQVRAHLDKALRAQKKKRALQLHKGDTVKVVRGKFKGQSGKIAEVSVVRRLVRVEGLMVKKQSGKELLAKIDPSNVIITALAERKGN